MTDFAAMPGAHGDYLPSKLGGRAANVISMVVVGSSQKEKDMRMLPQRRSPVVRKRPTNQPTAHDLLGQKRSPIWLGSSTKYEHVAVPDIRQCREEEFEDSDTIDLIERFEATAKDHEAVKKFVAAAECLDQAVALRRKVCFENEGVLLAAESACCLYNYWGTQCLAAGQYTAALELLKKAEALTDVANVPNYKRRISMRAATFGNLACYFRARGKLNAALRFSEKAIRIEKRYKNSEDPARTILNYAVLLSAMGRHDDAVESIESAIALIRETMQSFDGPSGGAGGRDGENRRLSEEEVTISLVVAHHNLWVEHSRRTMHELGAGCLLRAANVARQHLGGEHPLTIKMEQSFATVKSLTRNAAASPYDDDDLAKYGVVPGDQSSPGGQFGQLPSLTPMPEKSSSPMQLPPRPATVGANSIHAHHEGQAVPNSALRKRLGSARLGSISTPPDRRHAKNPAEESIMSKLDEKGVSMHKHHHTEDVADHGYASGQERRGTASARGFSSRSSSTTPMMPRPPSSARYGTASPRPQPRHSDARFPGRAVSVRGQAHTCDRTGADSAEPAHLPPRPATVAAHHRVGSDDEDESPWLVKSLGEAMRHGRRSSQGHSEVRHDVHSSVRHQLGGSSSDEEHGYSPKVSVHPTEDWLQTTRTETAADRIQARHRGFYTREIMEDEVAKDYSRSRRVHALMNSRGGLGRRANLGGMGENKRREAWQIVHSARQVYVENGAAVTIQKCWRGYITRHTVQEEIARIAHETATQLQSLFRRYCVIQMLKGRVRAAMMIQASWRRYSTAKAQRHMTSCKVLVTRLVVGSTCRRKLWRCKKSAILFERIIRGSNTRNRLRHKGSKKTEIQKVIRGTVWRRKLRRMSKAVAKIAARWRGVLARKDMEAKHKGAEKFQTLYRKYKARCRVARMQWAGRKIISLWNSYRMREMMSHSNKGRLIQAWFRGLLVRKRMRRWHPAAYRIQLAWRESRQRQRFKTNVAIAIVLQKHARRHLVNRALRELNGVSVSCQKFCRGYHWRRRLLKLDSRALHLQSFWRGCVSRLQVSDMHASAVHIQNRMRTVFAGKRWRERRLAAAVIRSAWAGHSVRRNSERRRTAALRIARIYRGHISRERVQTCQDAATRIQDCWQRSRAAYRWQCRWNAAVKIQAMIRARVHGRRFRLFRVRCVRAVQALWRRRAQRRRYKTARRLAIALQAACRGVRARKRLAHRQRAAASIQRTWRDKAARDKVRAYGAAAERIQAHFRGVSARREDRRQRKAATDIQRVLRGNDCRAQMQRRAAAARIARWLKGRVQRLRYLRKRQAAVRLQAHWRYQVMKSQCRRIAAQRIRAMWLLRVHLREQRCRSAAALWIQRCWRRKAAWLALARKQAAAVRIQQGARRWLVYHRLSRCTALAVKLQAHSRRKLAQRLLARKRLLQSMVARLKRCSDARKHTGRMACSSGMIGSTAEMHLTDRSLDSRDLAAVQIQRIARGHLTRCRVHNMRNVAPLAMQCLWRAIKAREAVEKRRAEEHRQQSRGVVFRDYRQEGQRLVAAIRIQAFARAHRARSHYRWRVLPAILKLQAELRMAINRHHYLHTMRAIVLIQTALRRYFVPSMKARKVAARHIQHAWRQHRIWHTPACNDYLQQVRAAIVIQSFWRFLYMRRLHKRKCAAACFIQAQMRASLGRRRYVSKRNDAVKIQSSLAKPFLCRTRVGERRQNVLKLQAFARRVLAKRRCRLRQSAATRLQALWRRFKLRHAVLRTQHKAATRIQAYVHMWRRMPYGPAPEAHDILAHVRTLQGLTRGFLVRGYARRQREAVCRIQRLVRYRRFKNVLQEARGGIVALQRIWRSWRSRHKVTAAVDELRKVPAICRGGKCRQDILPEREAAAVTIQRILRGGWCRVQLAKHHRAAVVLQSYVRMRVEARRFQQIKKSKRKFSGMVFRWRWRKEMLETLAMNEKLRRVFKTFLPYSRQKRVQDKIVYLQRVHRAWISRRGFEQRMHAAAVLQSVVRLAQARQHVRRTQWALSVLQAGLDSMHKRRAYAKRRRQLIMVQARMRGIVARKNKDEMKSAAIDIVRVYRGFKVRQREHAQDRASAVIGSAVRAWLLVLKYRRLQDAVRTIQTAWLLALAHRKTRARTMAATTIASVWRGSRCHQRYQRVRAAGSCLVTAAWMWRHMQKKTAMIAAATRIASVWRGYCVRYNLFHLRTSANRVARWWRNQTTCSDTLRMVFDIMVVKRQMQMQFMEQHAIRIQRFFRRWRRWRHGMYLVKRMVLSLQSRYRSWGPKREVALRRAYLGVHIKRLPSQLVALVHDKRGKLTRYRAFRPKERICPHIARIVRLKALPATFREDLEDVVGVIQGFTKFKQRQKKILLCQKTVRRWMARRYVRRKRDAILRLQNFFRQQYRQAHGTSSAFKRVTLMWSKVQAYVRGYVERGRQTEFREQLAKKRHAREEQARQLEKEEMNNAAARNQEDPDVENVGNVADQ